MKRLLPTILALMLALALPAAAHDGEDHGAPGAKQALTAQQAPRAQAATELFELVAVADDARLMLYLDRFESNEPVAGAQVDVESGTLQAAATEVEPGIYQVLTDVFGRPGVHALTIDVRAGSDSDLLALTLEGAAASAPSAPSAPVSPSALVAAAAWNRPIAWGASGAALVIGAWLVAWWRNGRATKRGKDAKT